MSELVYRPDWEAARERLTRWWNGGDLGRAAMQITVPRDRPWEAWPPVPKPAGWMTDYSTRDLEYHVYVRLRGAASREYCGEAVPSVNPGDLAPNCLALYLGCAGREMPGTVWCEPWPEDPAPDRFGYDPGNYYWRFSLQAIERTLELAGDKVLVQFPDLIEGLDTLAAIRGTEALLLDLVERPAWVHACLERITDAYFRSYDRLYHLIRDRVGGSVFWAWAPGRMTKLQCDFSALISPAMFREFMLPPLAEMTERVSYCMYHWDGPGAVGHLPALLSLPRLTMLQWTPGAGQPPTWDRCWWPLYHQALEAGRKLLVGAECAEHLRAYRREFGERSKQLLINVQAASAAQAEEYLAIMEV